VEPRGIEQGRGDQRTSADQRISHWQLALLAAWARTPFDPTGNGAGKLADSAFAQAFRGADRPARAIRAQ